MLLILMPSMSLASTSTDVPDPLTFAFEESLKPGCTPSFTANFHVLSRNKSMKKCQYIQGKKYEKQRNSEKMWRFDDFVGTSEHRIIGI